MSITKQDIEYAALVMGFKRYRWLVDSDATKGLYILDGVYDAFLPLEDDGDSRRLEIACFEHLHATSTAYEVERTEEVLWLRECYGGGKPERVREAVFALAVAIGKVISAGDAIDGGDSNAQS
jgi:hypothetical protein